MRLASLLKFAALLAAAVAAYARFVRPRVLNHGASADEAARTMPGDDILPNATLQTTRAVTVQAGPEHIWPWLVQMGPEPRAGAYTYDWLERVLGIQIRNRDEILPEYQRLEAGEFFALGQKGNGIRVVSVDPERSLVLQWVPQQSTSAFALYPQEEGRTRLLSRNRIQGSGLLFWLGMTLFMESGSLVMERKMLLTIRDRAQRLAGRS